MKLVSTKDIYQASGLKKIWPVGYPVAWLYKSIGGINKLNDLYNRGYKKNAPDFLDYLLDDLNVTYELHEVDLNRIPKEGPFVIVSNHPLGALDGILMMHIIGKIRPDFKVMGNFLLHKIKPLEPMVIAVNPFETRKEVYSSSSGMREAMRHVWDGGCLGIFPAGEVSTKDEDGTVTDRAWQESAIKLIKKLNVPIIPMYFRARNSPLFYRMAALSPNLQTAMLPSEMVRPRTKPIQIRIGKPILLKQQNEFDDIASFSEFLRKKTYALSTYYTQKRSLLMETLKIPSTIAINSKSKKPKPIVGETDKELILSEINELRKVEDQLLFKNNNYECYFTKAHEIPNILREIGRLRELTFREIGEGTNQEIDLDRYDVHYHHMFLWDEDTQKIVGAYRMALGKEVYEQFGVNGFYLHELFHIEPELHPFFKRCIEMGRAFVVPEYQQKPMPLFLLWRGIVHVTLRNPEEKYIIGSVSISNQFSDFSKSLMIEFMKSHYYDPYVAQYVRPKNEFKIKLKDEDKEFFFDEAEADLNKFDKLIDEIEPNVLRLPVLIKKYIKQNAKLIGFNVDPKFNDAIDGLMYIRISDLPESTVKPVLEEFQAELNKKLNGGGNGGEESGKI
ncbi:lysophospholipid acyltransferase family protein [Moheibacter lacus]|uniref:Lysophospholipid acyltransferase family protein n=1 Tax=Moheibacter lacus TaxID=2745851 RepID=A0A838ZHG2_9FLAO|nr:GNAT family N-acyltransferase [Moheibacter lacus]MBA5629111.1 lysophospholipid acyltransferase family protein [Moheibacter lacus]